MGAFDTIVYKDKLPNLKLRPGQVYVDDDQSFQTKSFINLDNFGHLDGRYHSFDIYCLKNYKYITEHPKKRLFLIDKGQLYFCKCDYLNNMQKIDYTGEIEFYKHYGNQFRVFKCKVKSGRVESIKRIMENEIR